MRDVEGDSQCAIYIAIPILKESTYTPNLIAYRHLSPVYSMSYENSMTCHLILIVRCDSRSGWSLHIAALNYPPSWRVLSKMPRARGAQAALSGMKRGLCRALERCRDSDSTQTAAIWTSASYTDRPLTPFLSETCGVSRGSAEENRGMMIKEDEGRTTTYYKPHWYTWINCDNASNICPQPLRVVVRSGIGGKSAATIWF